MGEDVRAFPCNRQVIILFDNNHPYVMKKILAIAVVAIVIAAVAIIVFADKEKKTDHSEDDYSKDDWSDDWASRPIPSKFDLRGVDTNGDGIGDR